MLTKRIVWAGMVTVMGLAGGVGTANAESYAHVDRLALQLQRQARDLESEFRAHFRHATHYSHLISDARRMAGLAAHIHEVAHHHGSPYHLRSDLRSLDRLFHHVEELVAHIEHDAHHGHVHGDTRHVRRLMAAISGTLHHLEHDIDHLIEHSHGHGHGHAVGRPGIVIGGGGIRIGIGY